MRSKQIASAMCGRLASQVNDNALRDAVRSKLVDLAQQAGRPMLAGSVTGFVLAATQAAAKTLIFESEVVIALEMGAAGELDAPTTITQSNVKAWITNYAVCGDRRAAQESISIASARDRARMDSVTADEKRRDFEREGLVRAWQTFIERGTWDFFPGFAAVLYDKIGRDAVRALLTDEQLEKARVAAVSACRRDYPQKYRTAKDEEIHATDVFKLHAKAQLCRAYFETLRERSLDITFNPVENERA